MVENQNWTSEFKTSFRNLTDLFQFLGWTSTPELQKVADTYPVFIPRKLALKMKAEGPDGILAREFLPSLEETDPDLNQKGMLDPIGDKNFLKAPQLIHRYKSRALFTPTTLCPVNCRYCFRKNELSAQDELFQQDFEKTLRYLNDHPEISEIIFTGGDPLNLSNEKLEKYLTAFAQIKSIKDIRFHSRFPVILPERIDHDFLKLMEEFSKTFRTVSIAIHANHKNEFDPENRGAIQKLSCSGVQLLSQSVLLSGVNDSSEILLELIHTFLELKIRPYYLHHPDHVAGGMHFYLPLQKGRMLYQALRKELPGWAIPQYVLDVPGGKGKISAFNPESFSFSGNILTLDGELTTHKEPDFFV